jgi:hypothetical protein
MDLLEWESNGETYYMGKGGKEMRPIKFRAWRSDFEEMIYNEFHITADGAVYSFGLAPECVLMQFTGLLDKNGKEIWEGDLVLCEEEGEVTFNDGAFQVQFPDDAEWLNGLIVEVIGNIYEKEVTP